MSLCVSKNVTPWDFLPFGKTKLEFNKRWKLDRFGYKERREESLSYPFSILGLRLKTLLGFLIWIFKMLSDQQLKIPANLLVRSNFQLLIWQRFYNLCLSFQTKIHRRNSNITKLNLAKWSLHSTQLFTFEIRYWEYENNKLQKSNEFFFIKDSEGFFSKWVNSSGHFQRMNFCGHFPQILVDMFLSSRIPLSGCFFTDIFGVLVNSSGHSM